MALLTCPDCGGKVSDSAPACPHCGRPMKATGTPAPKAPAPKPKANASGCLGVILLAVIIFIVIGAVTGSGDKASDSRAKPSASEQAEAAKKAEDDKACRQDLSCIAEKHLADAAVYCKDPIEARAAHDVKWTDGTFELKMSRYRWSDAGKTAVTYIGDKVAFQNGFGAFTPMTYFCTLDVDHDVVTDVQVIEGRLPSR